MSRFLEAGQIVGTHGVHGEVKIEPWADSPEFLCGFKTLYIDGNPRNVVSMRVHKRAVIALFDGVGSIDDAIFLKNKTVSIDRNDAPLEAGRYFISDLIGLMAVEADTGRKLGRIKDIMTLQAHDIYVISGRREILVPAVPEFVRSIDLQAGTVTFRLIEGME